MRAMLRPLFEPLREVPPNLHRRKRGRSEK